MDFNITELLANKSMLTVTGLVLALLLAVGCFIYYKKADEKEKAMKRVSNTIIGVFVFIVSIFLMNLLVWQQADLLEAEITNVEEVSESEYLVTTESNEFQLELRSIPEAGDMIYYKQIGNLISVDTLLPKDE